MKPAYASVEYNSLCRKIAERYAVESKYFRLHSLSAFNLSLCGFDFQLVNTWFHLLCLDILWNKRKQLNTFIQLSIYQILLSCLVLPKARQSCQPHRGSPQLMTGCLVSEVMTNPEKGIYDLFRSYDSRAPTTVIRPNFWCQSSLWPFSVPQ